MKKRITILLSMVFAAGCILPAMAQNKATDSLRHANQFNYIQALEVMGSILGNVEQNFVDTVSMERLSKIGIRAMLSSLDPYTEYFAREDNDQLKLLTKGEYAGIGSIISQRPDSSVIINSPMQGQPAAEAGLRAGDVILEIDGRDFRKSTTPEVSAALKGLPGTTIKLKIHRPGEKKDRMFTFKRAKIVVDPVTYYSTLGEDVGYIRFSSFTDQASRKVETALRDLKDNHGIKSLVLDMRSNGGGLVGEAVRIVNFFVPKGREVMSIKGRPGVQERTTYSTQNEPIDTTMPVVVLIDGHSASSAEIVAGALQDLDRAVVIGNQSYGKGLVQSPLNLPYNGTLKITTGRYYIPSGRCIQRIDYQKAREGKTAVLPDSLTHEFHTAGGRPVKDAGGILPDITIKQDSLPTILFYMDINNDVFDFITDYVNNHDTIAEPEQFSITDADYARFEQLLKAKKFDYDRQSSKVLEKLKEVAEVEGYLERAGNTLKELEAQLKPDLSRDMKTFKKEITDYLNNAIISRYYYQSGAVRYMLKSDKDTAKAVEILKNPEQYKSILTPKKQS
ncbi:S41 family peptidase [Porphyromonas macacae]|nr:S41 family peptidase [Porphyromonas macacae]